jgi:hypothetical protein
MKSQSAEIPTITLTAFLLGHAGGHLSSQSIARVEVAVAAAAAGTALQAAR